MEESITGPAHPSGVRKLHRASHVQRKLGFEEGVSMGVGRVSVDLPSGVQNSASFGAAAHLWLSIK